MLWQTTTGQQLEQPRQRYAIVVQNFHLNFLLKLTQASSRMMLTTLTGSVICTVSSAAIRCINRIGSDRLPCGRRHLLQCLMYGMLLVHGLQNIAGCAGRMKFRQLVVSHLAVKVHPARRLLTPSIQRFAACYGHQPSRHTATCRIKTMDLAPGNKKRLQ